MAPRYSFVKVQGQSKMTHLVVAERALGKPLPAKAVVHHVDGNGRNNAPSNLVICQDQSYHLLLHRRERALAARRRGEEGNPMSDRTPKPGTAIYLLRDVPRTDLKLAHAALETAGEGRTLKQALLDTIAKLAATEARRRALVAKARKPKAAPAEAPAPAA